MKRLDLWLIGGTCILGSLATSAEAIAVNGSFENGDLSGWVKYGDVSVQTASFGISPPDGQYAAVLTTLSHAASTASSGEDPAYGTPVSGIDAISGAGGRLYDAMGLAVTGMDEYAMWDEIEARAENSTFDMGNLVEGSVIKQTVFAHAGESIVFDYNFFSGGGDIALVSINGRNFVDPLNDLELLYVSNASYGKVEPYGMSQPTYETGFHRFLYQVPFDYWYTVAIGVFDTGDTTVASGIVIDNFDIVKIPEPATFLLMGIGLAGLGFSRRKKSA